MARGNALALPSGLGGGRAGGRGFKGQYIVESLLVFCGSCALAATWPGAKIAQALSWVAGMFDQAIGAGVGGGAWLALLIVIGIIIIFLDLRDKELNMYAYIGFVLIPLLAAGASGVPGNGVPRLVGAMQNGGSALFYWLLG